MNCPGRGKHVYFSSGRRWREGAARKERERTHPLGEYLQKHASRVYRNFDSQPLCSRAKSCIGLRGMFIIFERRKKVSEGPPVNATCHVILTGVTCDTNMRQTADRVSKDIHPHALGAYVAPVREDDCSVGYAMGCGAPKGYFPAVPRPLNIPSQSSEQATKPRPEDVLESPVLIRVTCQFPRKPCRAVIH